jgi:CHAT domain-containing protein/tetratricopeptide (TPR) repeat protein
MRNVLSLRRAVAGLLLACAVGAAICPAAAEDDARTKQLRLLCAQLSGDLTDPGGMAAFRRCLTTHNPIDEIRRDNNIGGVPADRPSAAPPAGFGANTRHLVASGIDRFEAIDGGLIYVVDQTGRLWRGTGDPKDASLVAQNVATFQVIDGHLFVLSTDGALSRSNIDGSERTTIDQTVAAFQPINAGLVYVLGTDRRLWRETGDSTNRAEVDDSVSQFQAIDDSLVFVLGSDRRLWREVGTKQSRTLFASAIMAFQYIAEGEATYVLTSDATLWRKRGSDNPAEVDKAVTAFQAVDAELAYVLGQDGRLWRELGGRDQAMLVDRDVLVTSGKAALQAVDPGHIYVLGNDHKLWAEAMPEKLSDAGTSTDLARINEDYNKATKLYESGKYPEAASLTEQILKQFPTRFGENEDYALIANFLAVVYSRQGRYSEAEPLYKHVLAIREKILGPNHPLVAASLDNLATLYGGQGRYTEAEPLFKRALAIFTKVLKPDDPDLALSLNNLGELYYSQGRYSDAEPLFKRALAIREKALGQDDPRVAASLDELGLLFGSEGRYAEAEPLVKRSVAIREKALGPDHPDLASSLNTLAEQYRSQARYAEAEPLYQRALAIYEKAVGPTHRTVAVVLSNLALLYTSQGRYADAEPLYQRALAIEEQALGPEHPELAQSLDYLAELYRLAGRYADAEPLYKRALAIKEKALPPDHPDLAQSLNNLAALYTDEGRYADAEPLYQRALAINEKALQPDRPNVAASLNNLAIVYASEGRYGEAEPLYKRTLAIYEKTLAPDHPDLARGLNNLAELYRSQGRYADSEPLYKRALAIYEKSLGPDHPYLATSLNNLALLYASQGRYPDALAVVRSATKRGFLSRPVHLSTLYGARTAGVVTETDAVRESFSVVQQASSSAASAALGQLAVRFAAGSGDLARLVRREQDLAGAKEGLGNALVAEISKASAERHKDQEQALRNELDNTTKSLDEARTELSARFPDYAALSRPQAIELADAQALLGDDEALVLIDLAGPGSTDDYIWALTRTSAAWKKLDTKKGEVTDEVTALRSELNPDTEKPLDAKLDHNLYEQTLGAVADVISGKHQLFMVLSGALTSLPPQVLITSDPTAKTPKSYDWLIRHYAVTLLPSVSSLKVLSSGSAKSAAAKPMTAYGNPVFKKEDAGSGTGADANRGYGGYYRGLVADVDALRKGLPALPETATEIGSVARSVRADDADIKLGSAATVTAVKQARLDQYRIVYFATHALVAGEVEEYAKIKAEPALVLSLPDQPREFDDGLLKASEVAQLKLDADMVVLSACNTAAGDKPGAEALSGLARAFFYAGARSLIVSHWPVESDAAVRLMTSTFSAMAEDRKLTPSQALTKSMLAMVDDPNDPDGANPSAWAPFIVVGGARSP